GEYDQSRGVKKYPMEPKITSFDHLEALAYRAQQMAFSVLTLSLTAALLLLHVFFSTLLGKPSPAVLSLLAFSSLAKLIEYSWLNKQTNGISRRTSNTETVISMVWLFSLAGVLAILTDRDDAPYFVLLAIPILQCAYHFGVFQTAMTIGAAIGMIFAWAKHFFSLHPPPRPTEFLESGMISLIYGLMGFLVWYLVNQIRSKESVLFQKMSELEQTRERLAREEKLAAVGQLASGIAHEIRNPVAMIASSLDTAAYPNLEAAEREEMFTIAGREAKRLERLTSDFLAYARPSMPQRTPCRIEDILQHVANATRLRAGEKSIEVEFEPTGEELLEIDPSQVEGALVNLGLNAVDATPRSGRIQFRTRPDDGKFLIDVENTGEAIRDSDIARIFEPFFTTKSNGTGLGLAIARGVARAHGGDLWISKNQDRAVVFTMSLEKGIRDSTQ
ncbi:MAG TPA: ATP-binding protein, partial [Terracidiphilus sp.]|nr:ATP-binding protein [Terracidiphilus sp.]